MATRFTHERASTRALVALLFGVVGGIGACERGLPPSAGVPSEVLPGAAVRSSELAAQLGAAAAHEALSGPPRTRHRRADGTARYTNRLILERSPYLRQHAHNPVDWYPWGEEAFDRARREGKVIFLSVGYATCHWCHVMEEESFEDEAIATRLNLDYVAIKVDREERPDVDTTYLRAVSLLTGGGGWPITVWLTPDRDVFFAGTYFPPRDGERGARQGLLSLLEHFAEAFRSNPASIAADGRKLTAQVLTASRVESGVEIPTRAVLDAAFNRYRATFDQRNGGFGRAPKFPMPSALDFLLRYHRRTGDSTALTMVQRTLVSLANGGVRDQLGGGLHRYATDAAWRVPHFEKMLYDNAQLVNLYLAVWQVTGDARFERVAREILEDMVRTLRAPEGAFYAAVDADDPVGEGAFYTWTPAEIAAVLTSEQAAAVERYYGVDTTESAGDRAVLRVTSSWSEVASGLGIDVDQAELLVAEGSRRLLAVRAHRPAPLVDTKILTGWNGLAISAFARAGAVLGEPRYVRMASDAATFVLDRMRSDGRLWRVYAEGAPGQQAFLDDYVFFAAGLLDLFEATFDLRWVEEARRLDATLAVEFWDAEGGGYFESGPGRDPSLPRWKPAEDWALPSGNAVAAETTMRLATLLDDDTLRKRATECLRAFGRDLEATPTSSPRLLGVVEALLDHPREIVLVEPPAGSEETAVLLHVVHAHYLPNRVLLVVREGPMLEAAQRTLPFVGEKTALGGRTTAYVCERGRCLLPTSDPATLARQLEAVTPLPAGEKGD